MELLKERIRKDGVIKEGNVLKVDNFLNHQMDVELFNEGSVRSAFAGLPVEVGAKTGTAQVGQVNSESNAVLVCFAPYDDPEIAVSVVVEHGGSGTDLAGIAAEILSYYFSTGTTMESVDGENQLLH